jgi:hypothetical protein
VSSARGEEQTVVELPERAESRPDLLSLSLTVPAAEAAAACGDAGAAERLLDGLEYLHGRRVVFTPGWCALTPRLLGAVHLVAGGHQRARELLTSALEIADERGAHLETGLIHLELARLDVARQEGERSREQAREAQRILGGLGVRAFDVPLERLAH